MLMCWLNARFPDAPVPPEAQEALTQAEEIARALNFLNSMFGEANQDWGGAESVDSDMEQAAAADVPHVSEPPLDSMDSEIVPASKRGSSVDRQMLTAALRNSESAREEQTVMAGAALNFQCHGMLVSHE